MRLPARTHRFEGSHDLGRKANSRGLLGGCILRTTRLDAHYLEQFRWQHRGCWLEPARISSCEFADFTVFVSQWCAFGPAALPFLLIALHKLILRVPIKNLVTQLRPFSLAALKASAFLLGNLIGDVCKQRQRRKKPHE